MPKVRMFLPLIWRTVILRIGGVDSEGPNPFAAALAAADVRLRRAERRHSAPRGVIPRDVWVRHLWEGSRRLPDDRALACALETIASKFNPCSKHENCVAANLEAKCSDAGSCPPLYVNREMKGGFEAEAQREINRYCENATCKSSDLCWVTKFEARWANSRCTWTSL